MMHEKKREGEENLINQDRRGIEGEVRLRLCVWRLREKEKREREREGGSIVSMDADIYLFGERKSREKK